MSSSSIVVLQPDERDYWLTQGMREEFYDFFPMGTKERKAAGDANAKVIFKQYCHGVATSRDAWAYNFKQDVLQKNIEQLIETYNSKVDRWKRLSDPNTNVDHFVRYNQVEYVSETEADDLTDESDRRKLNGFPTAELYSSTQRQNPPCAPGSILNCIGQGDCWPCESAGFSLY